MLKEPCNRVDGGPAHLPSSRPPDSHWRAQRDSTQRPPSSMKNASGLSPAAGCARHLRFPRKAPFPDLSTPGSPTFVSGSFPAELESHNILTALLPPLSSAPNHLHREIRVYSQGPGWLRSLPVSSAPSPSGSSHSFESCSPDLQGLTSTYRHRLLSLGPKHGELLPSLKLSLIPGPQAHLPLSLTFSPCRSSNIFLILRTSKERSLS